jgi:hypothetical protein
MRRAFVAGAAVLALVALAVGSFALTRDEKPALTRAQYEAWESAMLPELQAGGRTVEQGMKAAIDDLQNRHVVPPATIATEADAWVESLTATKGRVAAVVTPDVLKPAQRDFLAALDGYVAAAREFKKAALAPEGAARQTLVENGIRHGEAADDIYDRGGFLVQDVRRSVGLPESDNFPRRSVE